MICPVNPLIVNPIKWSNILKQFAGCCRRTVWVCLTILWSWYLKWSWRQVLEKCEREYGYLILSKAIQWLLLIKVLHFSEARSPYCFAHCFYYLQHLHCSQIQTNFTYKEMLYPGRFGILQRCLVFETFKLLSRNKSKRNFLGSRIVPDIPPPGISPKDFSPNDISRKRFPQQTVPRTGNSPKVHFPDGKFPEWHFPERAFPRITFFIYLNFYLPLVYKSSRS